MFYLQFLPLLQLLISVNALLGTAGEGVCSPVAFFCALFCALFVFEFWGFAFFDSFISFILSRQVAVVWIFDGYEPDYSSLLNSSRAALPTFVTGFIHLPDIQ